MEYRRQPVLYGPGFHLQPSFDISRMLCSVDAVSVSQCVRETFKKLYQVSHIDATGFVILSDSVKSIQFTSAASHCKF